MELSKSQLPKIVSAGEFCGLIKPLLKHGLPLMKNARKTLAKSLFIPLGWTAEAPATDSVILESGMRSWDLPQWMISIISIEEMEDIMK